MKTILSCLVIMLFLAIAGAAIPSEVCLFQGESAFAVKDIATLEDAAAAFQLNDMTIIRKLLAQGKFVWVKPGTKAIRGSQLHPSLPKFRWVRIGGRTGTWITVDKFLLPPYHSKHDRAPQLGDD